MIEEFSKVNELPQAQEVVEESIVIHVVEETSNENSCDNMNEKGIEKQESEKEEKRGKEIVLLEKSEEVNFNANEMNSFLTSESLWELKAKEGTWRKSLAIFLRFAHKSISYPSLMCYEVSLVGLELLLESYLSHVSIYGDLCAIYFGSGLFLVVPYVSKCLSSYAFLEDSLLHSSSMFDPSCYDFRVKNNAFIESIIVGFRFDGALFYILHDKCLGKFVENVGYVSSFLDTFMENHNDSISLNQLISFVSGQVEFSYSKQKLSNAITSLNPLFQSTFGFQFCLLHSKEFSLKDFENQMETNLDV
ncbi:hypothetical protein M9H77_23862 [Catharanthus roseus]|uniref:Uncharacterized protein n=1 Tax=Catharanthus roseus TaxID=4058 RepID=A0ACC0AUG4_CATRO|nr:hypothetical protein M9H77_23862 [Catharanthus roseus]